MIHLVGLLVVFWGTALCASGCPAGRGDGWVMGSVHIASCQSGQALARNDDFDLGANFFVGDPLFDFGEIPAQRRSSVTLRIQNTSNQIEQSDGLLVRLHDVQSAARAFSQGELLPANECFDLAGCASGNLLLRAQLHLYNICPNNKGALTASPRGMRDEGTAYNSQGCWRPEPAANNNIAACPTLSAADKTALQSLCDKDFNDRSNRAEILRLLGSGDIEDEKSQRGNACLALCQLGGAKKGMTAEEIADFQFNYGERIAAIFVFNMVDARSFKLNTCGTARGRVYGMFNFEMVRSRAAQAFP